MDHVSTTTPALVTVLGETTIDGGALTAQQRSLIAALVMRRATGASTDALIDALWPDEIPSSSRQSLQNQIGRIRRRHGDEIIVTRAGRYHLAAVADVDRYGALVEPLLLDPASPTDVSILTEAEKLWQGEPYQDLYELHAVEAERARLQELHAQATERLALCRLLAGDVRRATLELTTLLGEDPYRERRWHLLLAALHLDGRRAEALSAYDRARATIGGPTTTPSAILERLRDHIEADEPLDLTVLGAPAPAPAPTRICSRQRHHRPSIHRCSPALSFRR